MVEVGTGIDRLLSISKSDLSDKMKQGFFQDVFFFISTLWMHKLNFNETKEKLYRNHTIMLRVILKK